LGTFKAFTAMALSPDGKRLATADPRTDRTTALNAPCAVRIWDVETGRQLHKLDRHQSEVRTLAFSTDGRVLVSGGRFRSAPLNLWEVKTGKLLRTLPSGESAVAFSPDGRTLAATNSGAIHLYETQTWQERGRLQGDGGITALAFTADCRRLISGSSGATGMVWDVSAAARGR
jgi:WD40 repeat protein